MSDGEGEQRVEQPHDDLLVEPAEVAGAHPEQRAHGQADRGGADPDDEGDPPAVEQPGELVVAERVGAEQVAGRAQGLHRVRERARVRRRQAEDLRAGEAGEHDQREHQAGDADTGGEQDARRCAQPAAQPAPADPLGPGQVGRGERDVAEVPGGGAGVGRRAGERWSRHRMSLLGMVRGHWTRSRGSSLIWIRSPMRLSTTTATAIITIAPSSVLASRLVIAW